MRIDIVTEYQCNGQESLELLFCRLLHRIYRLVRVEGVDSDSRTARRLQDKCGAKGAERLIWRKVDCEACVKGREVTGEMAKLEAVYEADGYGGDNESQEKNGERKGKWNGKAVEIVNGDGGNDTQGDRGDEESGSSDGEDSNDDYDGEQEEAEVREEVGVYQDLDAYVNEGDGGDERAEDGDGDGYESSGSGSYEPSVSSDEAEPASSLFRGNSARYKVETLETIYEELSSSPTPASNSSSE